MPDHRWPDFDEKANLCWSHNPLLEPLPRTVLTGLYQLRLNGSASVCPTVRGIRGRVYGSLTEFGMTCCSVQADCVLQRCYIRSKLSASPDRTPSAIPALPWLRAMQM